MILILYTDFMLLICVYKVRGMHACMSMQVCNLHSNGTLFPFICCCCEH